MVNGSFATLSITMVVMTSRPEICIVGAGQLGSRHLQALQNIPTPLSIHVIDPSPESLTVARERFESIPRDGQTHEITFGQDFESLSKPVDIAIVATNSDHRAEAVRAILKQTTVSFMVLEKLLFRNPEDYDSIPRLLKQKNVTAFVNCSMRTMPFYFSLKEHIGSGPITYTVAASQFGLITNAIHYIDHMAFLSGGLDYHIVTDGLDPKTIPSKRRGFLELNGTLGVDFANGSHGSLTCFGTGALPVLVEIASDSYRVISRETQNKVWITSSHDEWNWKEIDAPIPFQSQMTTTVVTDLLTKKTCDLVPLEQSITLHRPLLEGLRVFLEKTQGQEIPDYPFT